MSVGRDKEATADVEVTINSCRCRIGLIILIKSDLCENFKNTLVDPMCLLNQHNP